MRDPLIGGDENVELVACTSKEFSIFDRGPTALSYRRHVLIGQQALDSPMDRLVKQDAQALSTPLRPRSQ